MRLLPVAVAAALASGLCVSAAASTESAGAASADTVNAHAASAGTTSTTLRKAVAALPLANEVRSGYSRSAFRLWTDADHDGCNTREEVLLGESRGTARRDRDCTISSGTWVSYYDRRTWTDPESLDIDHVVPPRRGVGLRRPPMDRRDPGALRQRPHRRPHPRRGHRIGQPLQGRPGPGGVAAGR